ncbi:hypothetical protein BMETH_2056_0 [methanotrophic bacterial endosymbiont of Bathymodiolus sp.]|nr:hypothetical protein BMETH_2056_0 [methanotrophic bacterial endosymbiont of Bathymodiolus sp.]
MTFGLRLLLRVCLVDLLLIRFTHLNNICTLDKRVVTPLS